MFRVYQACKVPHNISFNINSDNPRVPPLNKIGVEFPNSEKSADEYPALYDKDLLCKLTFFRQIFNDKAGMAETHSRVVQCQSFGVEVLELAIGLVVDGMNLEDLLDEDSLANPCLYEDLEEMLTYFAADEAPEILKDIRQNQLPCMTFDTAEKVLQKWATIKLEREEEAANIKMARAAAVKMDFDAPQINPVPSLSVPVPAAAAAAAAAAACVSSEPPAASSSSPKRKTVEEVQEPCCVTAARKMMIASIYFKNREEAQTCFQVIKDYQQEINAIRKTIATLEAALVSASQSPTQRQITVSTIDSWKQRMSGHLAMQQKEQMKTDVTKAFIQNHHYASQHLQNPDPEIRALAAQSLEIVANYRKEILTALEGCGAKMARTDLLSHLVGPDAFLLEHYGLKPAGDKKEYPFVITGLTLEAGYRLENPSAWDLEEEIRTDIQPYLRRGEQLPPRIVNEKIVTLPMSADLENLRCNVLPRFNMWSSLSPDVQAEIKMKIIQFNKWDQYGVLPEHIEFAPTSNDMDNSRILGDLRKGYRRTIVLNTVTFALIVNTNTTNPDSVSTAIYLKSLQ